MKEEPAAVTVQPTLQFLLVGARGRVTRSVDSKRYRGRYLPMYDDFHNDIRRYSTIFNDIQRYDR